jgi:hypothetical protein
MKNWNMRGKEGGRKILMKSGAYGVVFVILSLAACASGPKRAEPEWTAGVAAVYPDAAYIAHAGSGASRESAEANALAAISRYFSTEINSVFRERYAIAQRNGAIDETANIESDTFVQSQTKLFAVRYAEDSFLNPATRQWETVAYIRRAEAWSIFGPEVKKQVDSFAALYHAADTEEDMFKRCFLFLAARRFVMNPEYARVMAFGQLLFPEQMNAVASQARQEEATLAQKISESRKSAAVFVDVPLDSNALVASALIKALTAEGFAAAKTKNEAAAVCLAEVSEGLQEGQVTAYHPSVAITLSGKKSGALFSCTLEAERHAAVTPEVAKRRAYAALAQAITDNFSRELNGNFEK